MLTPMLKHSETKILPHKAEDLFNLVADIEKYPEFLPWCAGARILSAKNNILKAELVINFKAFTESYISKVELKRKSYEINVEMLEGPFTHLDNKWKFTQLPDETTEVYFEIDFSFKSKIIEKLVGLLFDSAARRMVASFEARAKEVC
jgi:coenzyme Q-binding protein COQ10